MVWLHFNNNAHYINLNSNINIKYWLFVLIAYVKWCHSKLKSCKQHMDWTIKNMCRERILIPHFTSSPQVTDLCTMANRMNVRCLFKKKVKWIEVCERLLLWALITSSKLCSDLCGLLSASLICLGNWPKGIILMNSSSLHALKSQLKRIAPSIRIWRKRKNVVYVVLQSMLCESYTYNVFVLLIKVMARE